MPQSTESSGSLSAWRQTGRYQRDEELLDHMTERLAELTDADGAGVEDRLARML
jgi:hypothetical protein